MPKNLIFQEQRFPNFVFLAAEAILQTKPYAKPQAAKQIMGTCLSGAWVRPSPCTSNRLLPQGSIGSSVCLWGP
jgi:hypothetical protein